MSFHSSARRWRLVFASCASAIALIAFAGAGAATLFGPDSGSDKGEIGRSLIAPAASVQAAGLAQAIGPVDGVPAIDKLAPELRVLVDRDTAGAEEVDSDQSATSSEIDSAKQRHWVLIQSLQPLKFEGRLAEYEADAHRWRWPAGEHLALVEMAAGDLLAAADMPGVFALDGGPGPSSMRPYDAELSAKLASPEDAAAFALRREDAPSWAETAARLAAQSQTGAEGPASGPAGLDAAAPIQDGSDRIEGWYDVDRGHAAGEAWELGYRGEGVSVSVMDDAVDFGHPDLQGTWQVLPEDHPYAGWPQAFDPVSGFFMAQDQQVEDVADRANSNAMTGFINMDQSSEVEMRMVEEEEKTTACFRPGIMHPVAGYVISMTQMAESCDWIVPDTSASGEVRFGYHPDRVLASLSPVAGAMGQPAGVIIVDENEAGVYDTVYVDIDQDRDFSDEKPMTHSDPLGWRDLDNDTVADLTGGLLYFIADGELPMPASWIWGIDEVIPEQGSMIAILWALGNHGTLCASNIVSQGRIGVPPGRELRFRDLEDGEPKSTNWGLAPDSKVVSIGGIYDVAGMFPPSWMYTFFGHLPDRTDDDIQVASNSYGNSSMDNDGWDADSRTADYYLRDFAPNLAMAFATGNGGPGYGTFTSPAPDQGLSIAASTQMGSTGTDSITDTTQITFGDVIPFSDRGPGSDGRNGPTIAADGAYASGATVLNAVTAGGGNGLFANTTWGGTSRATPVAAGGLALIYQAFMAKHDRWPTHAEARAIAQAGARDASYDGFVMGAGILDAGDSVRIAAGLSGAYAEPSEWTPGGYRGTRYANFAKMMSAGDSIDSTITLHNTTDADLEMNLRSRTLRRQGNTEIELTTDATGESGVSPSPDYLIALDREQIPEGTELMIARGTQHFTQFDSDANYAADNTFSSAIIQHTDINGDGLLWDDENENEIVNHAAHFPAVVTASWDDESREIGALPGIITQAIPDEGIAGELAWYGLACNDPDGNRPAPVQEMSEKVALIERGACTFHEKITNAQEEGATAVILFTDGRAPTSMGGSNAGITLAGVMMARKPGLELQEALMDGAEMTVSIDNNDVELKGIDGGSPLIYEQSEIQQYEYMRITADSASRNNWSLNVHHPLERWSDGLYLAYWHAGRNPAITHTNLTTRLDYYAHEDWDWLSLGEETVTVPAGGSLEVPVSMMVPGDTGPGAYQGAIVASYARGEGDMAVEVPGGWEPEMQHVVIPVNVNVAASYDGSGSVLLGSSAADPDMPYDNGSCSRRLQLELACRER